MSVYFEEEGNVILELDVLNLAEKVIAETLDYEQCPYEAEVEVLLTSNEVIKEMNREYRQIDSPTDVLSFPMIEFTPPGDYDFLDSQAGCFHPDSGELLLGNIVVSKDKVLEQAAEYGHSSKREYAFLITHSVLHLLGYDHLTESDRNIMEKHQEAILKRLQILR